MSTRIGLLLGLLVGLALAQEPTAPQQKKEVFDLSPHYTLGGELEGEATLNLELTVRMQVPAKNIDHRTLQAQEIVRRFHDTVAGVKEGKIDAVKRLYVDHYERQRMPGSRDYQRLESPLHKRTLAIGLDSEGKRQVTAEGEPALSSRDTQHEVHTERYESVLPTEPVSVGDKWTVTGDRLRRAVGNGFGEKPVGQATCRFVEVKEENLDPELAPDAEPQRYAIVQVDLETKARMGPRDEDPDMACHLTGELWFSLAERKLAKVELQGMAHVHSVEREGDVEVKITATGPLKIGKRFWFPRKPEPPQQEQPPADPGLPTPPERR